MEEENPQQQSNEDDWQFEGVLEHYDDPLLRCLLIITKLENKPFSEQALTAGLPMIERRLTPELFVRAAARVGLSAEISKHSLKDITRLHLPAVLLLEDKQACVLVDSEKDGKVQIIQPETASGALAVETEKLNTSYTGYAIFVKPEYRFNQRAVESLGHEPKHWFWDAIVKNYPVYGEVLVASFVVNLFALAIPLFIMNVYDRVVPNFAIETLWVLAFGVFLIIIFDFIMRLLRSYFIDIAARSVDVELSAKVYEQLLDLRMDARPNSIGVLSNTVQAFESFREFITSASISLIIDLPFVLLFVIVIAWIGGPLAYIPLIAIPVIIAISVVIQIPLNKKIRDLYRVIAEKQGILVESLNGIETLKTNAAESPLQQRWENITRYASKLSISLRFLSNFGMSLASFIQHVSTIALIVWGVYLILHGELSVGGLIACTILMGRALSPMSQVAALCMRYFQSKAAFESLDIIMQAPTERSRDQTYLSRPQLFGDIEFKDVCFRYPDEEILVLDKASFHIKQGERVGIIGRIGSGKTTISKILLALYRSESGNVLLDSTEIKQIDPADLRRNIGYVPQDIILFNGSVKDNVVFGTPYIDDKAIIRACRISGVDKFVNLHPDGLDMRVGEKGGQISGGQRQSIALARSLLLDPNILIWDEPTSMMDDNTEGKIKQRLEEELEGKTLVLITQRGSTLSLVDRLIILERGKVIADGPKEQILRALSEAKIKLDE